MQLFYALSAALDLVIVFTDTKNAYQQSSPPTEPYFLEIDDVYHCWYGCTMHEDEGRKDVIDVL
jgi:hypothetical protein